MKRIAFLPILIGSIFLAGCGSESREDKLPTKAYNNNKVPHYVQTYIIEADGMKYRCFDTGSYHGGIWCITKNY